MKRIITIILAMMIILTACASNDVSDADTGKDASSDKSGIIAPSDENTVDTEDVKDDDNSVTVFLPTTVYFSEEHVLGNANTLEYDEYGNMTKFNIISSKSEPSDISRDDNGRITSVKNFHRDTYYFEYNDDGSMAKITGKMNYGENNFNFVRSEKEGCAYELTVYFDKNYVVEQYSDDFLLLEQLYYTYDNETEPFHRRFYTYDENGMITKWEKAYDGRYDFTDNYTASDFDEMKHCMTQNLIDGMNFVYTEYTRNWTSTVEKDSSGRVIKDTHTYPDVEFVISYGYTYSDDTISEFTYTVDNNKDNLYTHFVYSPVKVKCDSLQLALINIYSQDVYANSYGSFYSITVDCAR